jgi:excisionase family DNA binding protein
MKKDSEIGILTLTQTAAKANKSALYINACVLRGELPAVKFGRSWMIKQKDLESWVQRFGRK